MSDDGQTFTMAVTINGTDVNPWVKYGLRQNPFPQLGKHEFNPAERQVASLDGEPVRSAADIRERLRGFTPEFVDLCIASYLPGERIRFTVTFPESR